MVSAAAMRPTHCDLPPIWSATTVREPLVAAGKPCQQTRANIRHADGDKFLIGIDLLSMFGRKDACGEHLVGVNQNRQGQGGGQQRKNILKLDVGERQVWQSGRHRADDCHTLCLQVKEGRGNNGDGDEDERRRAVCG